jgi:hypothetical protein
MKLDFGSPSWPAMLKVDPINLERGIKKMYSLDYLFHMVGFVVHLMSTHTHLLLKQFNLKF